MGTWITGIVVAIIVGLAGYKTVKDNRKKGCAGGCEGCKGCFPSAHERDSEEGA